MDTRVAVRMQLKPGCADQYERRHQQIWPELEALLIEAGIYDYSIFLDRDGTSLFAVMRQREGFSDEAIAEHPVMRRWWDHMAELMIVEGDNRPKQWPMREVFRLDDRKTAANHYHG